MAGFDSWGYALLELAEGARVHSMQQTYIARTFVVGSGKRKRSLLGVELIMRQSPVAAWHGGHLVRIELTSQVLDRGEGSVVVAGLLVDTNSCHAADVAPVDSSIEVLDVLGGEAE